MTEVVDIAIDAIRVGSDRRAIRDIENLVDSIREVGLLSPIIITPDHRLVAGHHRLEACRFLGWETIPCIERDMDAIDAEISTIDENLVRNDLTILERAEAMDRRRQLYEAKHPDSRQYSPEKQAERRAVKPGEPVSPGFTADTAARTGFGPRSVQQDLQIAGNLPEEVKDLIRDTPIGNKKRELLELARLDPEEQTAVAKMVARGEATSVRGALIKSEDEGAKAITDLIIRAKPLPEGAFDVVLAEPGWGLDHEKPGAFRLPDDGRLLSVHDLMFHVPVARMAAREAVLFVSAPPDMLRYALNLISSWDFDVLNCLVVLRDEPRVSPLGPHRHDLLLFGGRGRHKIVELSTIPESMMGALDGGDGNQHDRICQLIEAMYPDARRLDLLATAVQPGWFGWFDQSGGAGLVE